MIPLRVLDPEKTTLIIVGVGGTGGYVLQQVARLLYAIQAQGRAVPDVWLVDGDTVEEKNLLRQYFLPVDVGQNKAEVLAKRYSHAYGLHIAAAGTYLTPETLLRELVCGEPSPYQSYDDITKGKTPIVVGCVDNAPTRRILHEQLQTWENVVYVDAGNGSVTMPDDPAHVDRYQLAKVKDSGWDGQVVAGVRRQGKDVLPFPGEVFPDLITPDADEHLPTEVRCGEVIVDHPQRLMTNVTAATCVLQYLHTLLTDGTLLHHRTFFNAREGFVRSEKAIDHVLEVAAI
ncbi:MAG: ThiF family adenylyltransferase [Bacilli bacterium]